MLLKIFLVGRNWEHEGRMRESFLTHSLNVCPFYLLFKDHKGWEGHMDGPPPTRGIAGASSGQNSPLSEIISMVVEPVVTNAKFGFEKISGTDMLSQVDQMNNLRRDKSAEIANQSTVTSGELYTSTADFVQTEPIKELGTLSEPIKELGNQSELGSVGGDAEPVPEEPTSPTLSGERQQSPTGKTGELGSRISSMRRCRLRMQEVRKKKEYRKEDLEEEIRVLERKASTLKGQRVLISRDAKMKNIKDMRGLRNIWMMP